MRTAWVLCACLGLSACGYQLVQPSPAQPSLTVAVRDNGAPLLAAALRSRLRLRGLAPQDTATAERIINVRSEATDRRLLAIDSDGRAAEYREEHQVQARARWTDGDATPWQAYRVTRDYAYDASVVLGKSQERQLILREMRIELADRIIASTVYEAVDTRDEAQPSDAD